MTGAAVKIVLAAYTLFILFLSVRSGPQPLSWVWNIDKVYHFLVYALMALLLTWTFADRASFKSGGTATWRIVAAAFVISTLFGVAMEVLQHFFPLRNASFFDALANALGALAGAVVAGWWAGRRALKAGDSRE